MGFSRQEYWSRLPCPQPGDLPNPGTEPTSLTSLALEGRFFFTTSTTCGAQPLRWLPMISAFFWAGLSDLLLIEYSRSDVMPLLRLSYSHSRRSQLPRFMAGMWRAHVMRDWGLPTIKQVSLKVDHVWVCELDYEECWALMNWCFWTVVLEKTLESPVDCKEIQPVHAKGDQSWVFIGRTDVEAETPIIWLLDAKSWLTGKDPNAGKDWGQEEKGTTEDEMVGWHHRLNGHEFGLTPGVGDGQGGQACCSSSGCKESDTTK